MAVKKPSTKGLGIYLALLLVFMLMATTLFSQSNSGQHLKYSTVLGYFENDQVSSFDLNLGSGNMTMTVEINNKKTELSYRVPNVNYFLNSVEDDIQRYNVRTPMPLWSTIWSGLPSFPGLFRCCPHCCWWGRWASSSIS